MAITLGTAVTDYLTAVTTSLTVGSDLGSSMRGAAQNYLRAQDMSTVLDLLQEAISSVGHAALSGTTTTITDTLIFTANESIGNVVVFGAATTTVALRGVESRILANTEDVLTVETLPAAVATGDVYTIRGGVVDTEINLLRQGGGRADAPTGSVYGDNRTAYNGMMKLMAAVGGTFSAALTSRVSEQIRVHPGAQPGENAILAEWISELQAGVEAHTIVAPGV